MSRRGFLKHYFICAGIATFIAWSNPTTRNSEQQSEVIYLPGSSQKVCQLTGEFDKQLQQYTLNLTESKFGVVGTDLGASLEHKGKIYFLFGDTKGTQHGSREQVELHKRGSQGNDSIAFTTDLNPEDCLKLQFITGENGKFLSPTVPGVSLLNFEVPTGGFSDGKAMYIFFATDHSHDKILGRSVLTRSSDAKTFEFLYEFSKDKFINVAPVVVNNTDVPGLPCKNGRGVLLWGTGPYRESNPYLAYIPLDTIQNKYSLRFFAGLNAEGVPHWSKSEFEAVELFSHPCMGEFSVAWNPFLSKWLMLYNCNQPRGINFRTSDTPWGPWSETSILFDPWIDKGYCEFMHVSWKFQKCDDVHDAGKENVWGGEYGPYMIPRFFSGDEHSTTIYYLMSTWNPYQVIFMKSTILKMH